MPYKINANNAGDSFIGRNSERSAKAANTNATSNKLAKTLVSAVENETTKRESKRNTFAEPSVTVLNMFYDPGRCRSDITDGLGVNS